MHRTGPRPATPPAASDRALVERARTGDADAFASLTAARLDDAWRLARAILGPGGDADDAVATTFAAAWRELPRLTDPDRFDDWLNRILLAECRMRLRAAPGGAVAGPPADLLPRTMAAVRAAPPRPPAGGRHHARRGAGRGPSWLPATVAVTAALVVMVALVAGPALFGRRGDPGAQATAGAPSATPGGPTATPPAGETPTAGPSASAPPVAGDVLRPGSLAMVTLDGDHLNVRDQPGTGDDSRPLRPSLPAGTRMLVVAGPVEADGYTWVEIQTDDELVNLFGWVATGSGDEPWIAPTAPRCWGDLDGSAVTRMARIDFLACHGDAEVRLQADARDLWTVHEQRDECGWVRRRDGCDIDNGWLLLPAATVKVSLPGGGARDLVVAMPPDLAARLVKLPPQTTLALTVAMDSPDATECRVRDVATGEALIPPSRAVTACRLQFIVKAVEFRQ